MPRRITRLIVVLGLALPALASTACSPEAKAKSAFEKYEKSAWSTCEKITQEQGTEPGMHYCSKVTSMALEMAIKDTGLDEAGQKKAIADWVAASPYGKLYADEEKRKSIPD